MTVALRLLYECTYLLIYSAVHYIISPNETSPHS